MNRKKVQITKEFAGRLVLNAQLLDGRIKLTDGKEGISQTIDQLGYIQIDTISVIKRSHHHTLWTRRKDYSEAMLHELQSKERLIFEYWGRAMSYLPISDYRYCLPRMNNFQNPTHKWIRQRMDECNHLFEDVLKRIKNEGPLSSKDFSSSLGEKSGTWWNWKPAKVALELLFWRGDLMITERRNFQKIYDLTERVLPENCDITMPDDDELGQFFVRRALSALGVADEKEIQNYMQPETSRDSDFQAVSKEVILKSINDLLDTEDVIIVTLTEDQNKVHYALSESIKNVHMLEQTASDVYLLSPFDNLIIQRERIKRLFGFDYAVECYVPAVKRRYGYFVLPILWGDRFVGRLDPKADRKKKVLIVRNLVFEPEFMAYDAFLPLLVNKLKELARFNDCERVIFEKVSPEKKRKPLESLCLKNAI